MTAISNRWAILALMFLVGLTVPIQLQAVPALAAILIKETGVSYAEIGVLTGLFLFPGIFLAVPLGVVSARIGDRLVLIIGLIVMAGASLLFATTEAYEVMFASRLMGGAGAVAVLVLAPKVITDWFQGKEIATAMAISGVSFGSGVGIAMASLPFIARLTSWQAAMALNVVPIGLAVALLCLIYRDQEHVPASSSRKEVPWIITVPEFLLSFIAGILRALFASGYIVFMSFLPPLLIEQGIQAEQAGLITSMAAWATLVSVPLGGYLSDRTRKPNGFIVCGSLGAALTCILVPYVAPTILWVMLFGFLRGGCTGGIMALPSQVLRPESRSTGFAIVSVAYFICMAAFPAIAGLILDTTGSAAAPLWFAGTLWLSIIGWLGMFRLLQHRWIV